MSLSTHYIPLCTFGSMLFFIYNLVLVTLFLLLTQIIRLIIWPVPVPFWVTRISIQLPLRVLHLRFSFVLTFLLCLIISWHPVSVFHIEYVLLLCSSSSLFFVSFINFVTTNSYKVLITVYFSLSRSFTSVVVRPIYFVSLFVFFDMERFHF